MAWDAYKKTKRKIFSLYSWWEREGRVHEDTAAELVLGLLDDTVDGHFLDVEDGEDGRGEDVHDSLRNLVARTCTAERRRKLLRTRVHACIYSPASIAEGKVEGIGLGRLAGFGDQAIRVEGHWVLVYLGIMHEVPISGS